MAWAGRSRVKSLGIYSFGSAHRIEGRHSGNDPLLPDRLDPAPDGDCLESAAGKAKSVRMLDRDLLRASQLQ